MPGPWKEWKSKNSFPTLSTVPWKSRTKREISTFPPPSFAAMGKWKTKTRFPTFPQPLAIMTSVLILKSKTKERKSAAARPPHFLSVLSPVERNRFHAHPSIGKCSGVSPEFLALPAKGQLQLQTGRRGFRRTEGCLGENSADPIGERIEPEGRNSKEALRDDQEFLAEDA